MSNILSKIGASIGLRTKLLVIILMLSICPLLLIWYQISEQLNRMEVFLIKDAQSFAMALERIKEEKTIESIAVEFADQTAREFEITTTRLLTTILSMVISISLILLLFARFFARRISRPLEVLEEAIRLWDGQSPIPVSVEGSGEVGQLGYQFSLMTHKVTRLSDEAEARQKALEKADRELMEFTMSLEDQIDKRTRKLQEALEKLRVLDKAKDEFLSLITHELKTPLTSITACAEALRSDVPLPERTHDKFLRIIQDEAERLTRLINEVLEYSRISAGKMPFSFEKIDLVDMVERSVLQHRPGADQKGISLFFVLPEMIDPRLCTVNADPDRIQQVLANLLTNALKFTLSGGAVQVKIDILQKSICGRQSNFARVQVSDNGIGIDPQDRIKVFERFAQAGEIDHHSEGTGLGMPIARGIVREHGGKIWFTSVPGKGTTFYFTLPINSSDSP